jgi:coenzyme F420-reducing hydrogenase delta subunit
VKSVKASEFMSSDEFTGKLDVLYVLRAFEKGADGVMVAG